MKISTKGRYAVRVMLDLAVHNTGEYIKVKKIAERQEISEKYLEQIISVLNKAGYVKSTRGAQGGYRIAGDPEDYTVGMILRLTEGNLCPVACLEDEENQENLDLAASFADLKQFADYNTGFMELEAGSIDALAMDIGVANYQIAQRDGGYVILPEKEYLATEQYAVGFLLGNESLRDDVQATLMEMVDDGTFMEIAEKYADFGLTDSVCLGK